MCLNETTPEGKGGNFPTKTKQFDKTPSETYLLVQDWGIISFYKAFLRDWKVIVNRIDKVNGCLNKKGNSNSKKTK
jgi:hypothetical protein